MAREVVANKELSAGLAADVREEEFLEPILPNAHVKPDTGGTGIRRGTYIKMTDLFPGSFAHAIQVSFDEMLEVVGVEGETPPTQ